MKRSTKILIGIATIFAVGAITGTLYAPDKGERTRRRLLRRGRWLLHATVDAVEAGKDNLQEMRDEIKNNLERVDEEIERLSRCQSIDKKD